MMFAAFRRAPVAPRVAVALCLALALALAASPARADGEGWVWFEYRLPVAGRAPALPRLQWRFWTDVRMSGRAGGLHQLFFRTGPLVFLTPWLFVGAHATIYADRLASGRFDQEVRAELEPNLFGRLGPVTFNDRNRLEMRWRASGVTWRYRNQLRLNYAPPGARWIPFVWDELLVDLSGAGVNQNRFMLGLGYMLTSNVRLEVGYMLRSRVDGEVWKHDNIGVVYLFVDVPATPTPATPRRPRG